MPTKIFLFIFSLKSVFYGQVKLDKKYISMMGTGDLKLKSSHYFKLTDLKKSKSYTGTWTMQHDTLILNYNYFKNTTGLRLFCKKQKETKVELLFVKGFFIRDKLLVEEKVFLSKKEYVQRPNGDNAKL